MKKRNNIYNFDAAENGNKMYKLMQRLYPICRSITGDGVRQTLNIIKEYIPLKIQEVPSGTKAFDWTVPAEWNIREAYIKNSKNKKIIDFKECNLHVLNYSVPVHRKMRLKELRSHLFTLPDCPKNIPYRTSYYEKNWGFCLSHKQFQSLKEDIYEVIIDSSLKQGHLSFGELYIKGEKREEVIFSCYTCHPSLCNDNLSGIVLLTFLAKQLLGEKLKYSYRFLFMPETIGAIVWLSLNEKNLANIKHGLIATCLGDAGRMTYKKTRDGNLLIDKAVEKVLADSGSPYEIIDFFPWGSDERQFCSPGFNLPIGSLMRTPYGRFPEYHTSADNLGFIKPRYLTNSLEKYAQVVSLLESNVTYLNLNPKCEPQLSKKGLYRAIGGQKKSTPDELSIFWVLNLSDGKNSLLDIAIRSGMDFNRIKNAADILFKKNYLRRLKG